jgi:hypothetical protein
MEQKSTYKKPEIKEYGTLKSITKGAGEGEKDFQTAGS